MNRLAACGLVLAVFGCRSAEPVDNEADVDDPAGKADGVDGPVGTYVIQGDYAGESPRADLLVLKTDMTFHRVSVTVVDQGELFEEEVVTEEGSYKFTRSTTGPTRYIRFVDADGELIDRMAWTMSGDALTLRWVYTDDEFEMEKQNRAWCDAPDDCGVQHYPQPRCIGEWECGGSNGNECGYVCGGPTDL
jgi:hypothetical protein